MYEFDATMLPRLLQCGASYSMPGFTPPGMETSEEKQEGIAAHWLALQRLQGKCAAGELIDRKAENGFYISDQMSDYVEQYVSAINGREGVLHKLIEKSTLVRLTDAITIKCRPDVVTDCKFDHVYIDDFKYGFRIVEPENNPVLLAYAMAYCFTRAFDSNVTFHLTIHQPRQYHPRGTVRTWSLNLTDLMAIKARWQMMFTSAEHYAMLHSGPECVHCPSQIDCPAARLALFNVIDVSASKMVDAATPEFLAYMSDNVELAFARLKNYKAALDERINYSIKSGTPVPNRHLEPNIGPLEWKEWVTPEMVKPFAGNKPIVKEKLITPTQAKPFIDDATMKIYAERPNKGMKVVKEDDQKYAARMFGAIPGKEN